MDNHQKPIVEALQDFVEPAMPYVNNFGRIMIDAYTRAEATVKAEHPHWFITYPEGMKIDSKRRAKIDSREKKKYYAIQEQIRETLGESPSELAVNTVNDIRVVAGIADTETEVHFLEEAFERPSVDPPTP